MNSFGSTAVTPSETAKGARGCSVILLAAARVTRRIRAAWRSGRPVRACARSSVRRILIHSLLIRSSTVPCGSAHVDSLNFQGSGACSRKGVEVRVLSSAPAFAHLRITSRSSVSYGWASPRLALAPPKLAERRREGCPAESERGTCPALCIPNPVARVANSEARAARSEQRLSE